VRIGKGKSKREQLKDEEVNGKWEKGEEGAPVPRGTRGEFLMIKRYTKKHFTLLTVFCGCCWR